MKAFSLIAVFLALFSGGNNIFTPAHMPVAKNGVMDLTEWSYSDQGFVYLNGEWEFYWNQLLAPNEVINTEQKKYRNILDNWKETGFATYKLKLTIKESGRYAIYIPMVLVTHKIWIDGNVIGAYGSVGTSRHTENPKIQNYIEEMYLTSGTHNITIQASNYRLQTGGVRLPISFGKYKEIQNYRELKLFVEALVLGLIGYMIVSHLITFIVTRRNYTNLYFVLFCTCNFLFFFFRSERFFLKFFLELNWEFLCKLGFSAIFSIIPVLLLFNHSLYPLKFMEKKLKPVIAVWGFLIAYVLFLPSYYYSYVVPIFKMLSLVIFVLIFLQAKAILKKKVKGTLIALSGVIIFAIGMANEILYDNRISQLSIFVPCNLYLLFTQSFLTSMKSYEAFKSLKKSREEISNQNIELNRLSNLKDEFLSNTTHELKTPLHGIMGIADGLKDGVAGKLNEKVKSSLSIIINSAQRLSLLVNDILDVQRLKNQDVILKLTSFDLTRVVDFVVSVSQPLLKDKPVELKSSIPPETFFMHADSNRLHQVIQNLVSNACKFTDVGSIEISAKIVNDMAYISVTDTGKGISREDQKRIFKRFERVEHMTAGSGLGLSISKSLVELHGGSTFLESTLGEGSRLSFTMPMGAKVIQDEEMQLPKMISYINETEVLSEITPELNGQQILVVDDEPVNLKVITDYLTMSNYKVHQCASGQSAVNT